MKKIILSVTALLLCAYLFAQPAAKNSYGKWKAELYTNDILKITFQPQGYTHNENITGSVVLKPSPAQSAGNILRAGKFSVAIKGNAVEIKKDKLFLSASYHASAEYKGFNFSMQPGEKIFGGGERALPLNRRGYRFNLYNGPWYGYGEGADNLNYSVPFITSSNSYALFFDNASKGYLDIGKSDADVLQYGAYSGELNFYIITGKDYPQILQQFWKLTGTQPLPPRWAMGSFMTRFGYTSEKQAREIYQRMQEAKIPFDAVIFDLFWFGDSIQHTLGNLDWVNKTKWPNPQKMIADFKKDGVQTILITEPFVLENTKTYNGFLPYLAVDSAGKPFTLTDFYFGRGGLIDMFRKDSKNYFWQFYKQQNNNGVAGWWGDLGEPEKHPSSVYHNLKDYGYKRLFSADEVHNVYGHNWTKMLYEKYAAEYGNTRLFSLNRSGFAGTQRYCIFPWSGDVSRSWSGFRAQLPIMLGMSMSGVPYIHADAGGFAGGEGDLELYVRWLQYAQYTPIFRPHGTALYEVDPRAFSFPSEIAMIDTPYKNYARAADLQRYQMLPYNYTLSYLQAANAEPLVSPLYFYFSSDTACYNVGDEFMWGKNILVAPVLEKGSKEKNIYLPAGNWYKWNTGAKQNGGAWSNEKLTLQNIPVFVKAGSIIPLLPAETFIRNTSEYSSKEITWHYYADTSSAGNVLFDDDGASKNSLTAKSFELITAKTSFGNNAYHFSFSSSAGNFAGKPASRKFNLVLHGIASNANITATAGVQLEKKINEQNEMEIGFTFTGKNVLIDVEEVK